MIQIHEGMLAAIKSSFETDSKRIKMNVNALTCAWQSGRRVKHTIKANTLQEILISHNIMLCCRKTSSWLEFAAGKGNNGSLKREKRKSLGTLIFERIYKAPFFLLHHVTQFQKNYIKGNKSLDPSQQQRRWKHLKEVANP